MDFDFTWLLIGVPIAFGLGWMASRLDLRQLRRQDRDSPRAYFKGLNLLLNEQPDKAIDAFIEAVQNDPDTAELHFALGNLFRKRGEFERAVRVHEHLIARADLKPQERHRAQHALAQDFLRAGLLDRAEAAYRSLEGTDFDAEARLALLSLYERSREWAAASDVAEELERRGAGQFGPRIAHFECERALLADAAGDTATADAALARARHAAPDAARPLVLAGQRQAKAGQAMAAMQTWDELLRVRPASFNLVALDYVVAAKACGQERHAHDALQGQYQRAPSMALLKAQLALTNDAGDDRQAVERLVSHLGQTPSLSAAQALMAQPVGRWGDAGLAALRATVDRAAKPVQRYRCAACGFEAQHWFWQCPGCLGWDSFPPQPIEEL